MIYAKLKLDNLEQIQKEVIKFIPPEFLETTKLDYVINEAYTRGRVLGIDAIRIALSTINLTFNDVALCAFTVCAPGGRIPVHVDKGPYCLSLNIPINNVPDNFVIFYETSKKLVTTFNGVNTYYDFVQSNFETTASIGLLKTDTPCIINTMVPHRVLNMSNDTRIMLLIRFKPYVDFTNLQISEDSLIELK